MPKRLRKLIKKTSILNEDFFTVIPEVETEIEYIISKADLFAALQITADSQQSTKNFCYNPEGRIQQFRGEGDLDPNNGPVIDTDNSISKDLRFSDGYIIEEKGFESTAANLEISYEVVEAISGDRKQRLEFTVDSVSGGVPVTDNLVKVAFLLDADERQDLASGSFKVFIKIALPRASTYTFYVKDAFTIYVEEFTIQNANTEEGFEFTIPANPLTRNPAQDTFISTRLDSLEVGVVVAGTKGAVNTEDISETLSDGYQTTSSAAVINHFLRETQESAMAVNDVFAITEFTISKASLDYKGYDYSEAQIRAQRYFQKSHIQTLPAYKRFIIFDVADDGTAFASNIGSFREHFEGCLIREQGDAKNPYLALDKSPVRLRSDLKTHSNRSIKFNINPMAVNALTDESTLESRSVSGLYMFPPSLGFGGRSFNLTSDPLQTFIMVQMPQDGVALDLSGHSPGTANNGFIPGWLSGNNKGVITGSSTHPSALGPEINVNRDSVLTTESQIFNTNWGEVFERTTSLDNAENTITAVYAHWFVESLVDIPGTLAAEATVIVAVPEIPVVAQLDKTVQAFTVSAGLAGSWVALAFPESFPPNTVVEVAATSDEATGGNQVKTLVSIRNITITGFDYFLTIQGADSFAGSARVSFIARRRTP